MTRWMCLAVLCIPLPLFGAPYSYFGGTVDARQKTAAIEDCEYRVLVEEQRCNTSLNKSQCIRDVHAECIERYAPDSDALSRPGDPNEAGVDE